MTSATAPGGVTRGAPGRANATASTRRAAVTAGAALLLMAVLAGIGYGLAVGGLVTPDDPARTAADVLAHQGLFRAGVVCLVGVAALDVVVAWALYRLLAEAGADLSLLAAALRLVYAAVFIGAISHLVGALDLFEQAERLGDRTVQLRGSFEITTFENTWNAGLMLFGVHLLLVGYLLLRPGVAPRVLGILVGIAGLGYVVDGVAAVLSDGTWPEVAVFTFVGEVVLAVWLLVRGGRVSPADSAAAGGR